MVAGLAAHLEVSRAAFHLDLDLAVAPGEVVALLGPNGAGKSTALRVLAGLLPMSAGKIEVAGEVLADTSTGIHRGPHERPVGVVFQDYLLFPHLSVLDNVAFGPRARGASAREGRTTARRWLDKVGMSEFAGSKPGTISGGQAQRVALARALATEPRLLLLDEPLAALDARTRLVIRSELRRHLAGFDGAVVVVTHDPIDAAVLADRLVVIESGTVVQSGTPAEIARRPRTDYVARLVGLNLLRGSASGHLVTLASGGIVYVASPGVAPSGQGPAHVAFRPAAVSLFTRRPDGSPRNLWHGHVVGVEPHGEGARVEVGGAPDAASAILAEVTQAAVADLGLAPGVGVWASVKASDVEIYPA